MTIKLVWFTGAKNALGQTLREYLETILDEHEEVTFQQWQTTDCSKMITQTLNVDEFIELLAGAIDNLTSHSYITKCQAKYLK